MTRSFVHPTALVETPHIGAGTRIWAYTHVMDGATVGADCNIGDHCFIETGAIVGNAVTIKNGNMIWDGVRLEDGVFVGPQVAFTNDLYPRSPRTPHARARYADRAWLQPTTVRAGASLGAGAVLLAGIDIGAHAMVAAGAIVTRSLPRHALAVGAPARVRGWVCRCGRRLSFARAAAVCRGCALAFTQTAEGVTPHLTVVSQATDRPVP